MIRTDEFLQALNELDETTGQTDAMLSMLMLNFNHAASGEESLSDTALANYAWALKAQNDRAVRAIGAISMMTTPAPIPVAS